MLDYSVILISLTKFENNLIPQIPKILAQYISFNPQTHNIFLEKKYDIDNLLLYFFNNFSQNAEINEQYILNICLKYFDLLPKQDIVENSKNHNSTRINIFNEVNSD